MTPHAVRRVVVTQLCVLIMAAALAVGAVACGRTVDSGPPATTIPPTQPAATSAPATSVSEGSISIGTPDDAASLALEPTVEGSLEREPQVTPPALLPGTAEPTVPPLSSGSTPESEGPTPTDTPVPPSTDASPTETPTPVPPTNTPEPPAPPTGNRIGQSAPDFEVMTIDGVTRSLADFRQGDKAVVLYFFSST